jgi:carboxypeptidase C (cathepsin A)
MLALLLALALSSAVVALPLGEQTIPAVPAEAAAPAACAANWTNGDVDCCVPYKGNEWWTSSLEIPLKKGWRQWTVDSQTAGYVTSYDSDFTFLTVKGSGHMV